MNSENYPHKEPIAIVGIGCRLPGDANTPEQLWQILANKIDTISDIPPDRWDVDALYHPNFQNPARVNVRSGGFIQDIDKFDAAFFGIAPMEAQRMDPQHRILLEVAFEAVEDAGIPLPSLQNSATGVFVGISSCDYGDMQARSSERVNIGAHTNTGNSLSIASARISYLFNLKGPSFSVDTACSSTLTAAHLACRSIWSGESSLALVGGVSALLGPELFIGFSKGGYLSDDGRCKSFAAEGSGFARSEGAGALVLKPLSRAQTDGDLIYAIIRGSAINQDGRSNGMTAPNLDSQIAMLEEAYRDANVDPACVQYVEAHGTGTPVGDPIEARSIGAVIGKKRADCCYIGSVKSNIGHLEAGSGAAGLIKLALSLQHRKIPANLHFTTPNPNIPFDELRLRVPTEMISWPESDKRAFAGINSFGFGGSNAHLVLEGYPQNATPPETTARRLLILPISARTSESLHDYAQSYSRFLESTNANIADICYSAGARKTHFENRLAVIGEDKGELREKLQNFCAGVESPDSLQGRTVITSKSKTAFVFSGQGPQWWAMGRELLEQDRLFRQRIDEIDSQFQKISGWSLVAELLRDEQQSRIDETQIAQPAIFALQIALAERWQEMGVCADAVVGHSIGEVAASYFCGALTFADAVSLIYHRSCLQAKASGAGKMLAAKLTPAEAAKMIDANRDIVSIAAINAPDMVTLAGDAAIIENIAQELEGRDIFHRFLRVNVPFHSHYMEPLREELLAALKPLQPRRATLPFYSTVTGQKVDGHELDNRYWYRNIRDTVLFTAAIDCLLDAGHKQFVEIGPHPIHASGISALAEQKRRPIIVVASLRRKEPEQRTLLRSLGKIFCANGSLDFGKFLPQASATRLPKYPFAKQRHWLETTQGRKNRRGERIHPLLEREFRSIREPNRTIWDVQLDWRIHRFAEEHRLQGPIVYPGAGLTELALSAATYTFGEQFCFLENIDIEKPLFLPEEGEPPQIRLEIVDDGGDFFVCTRPHDSEADWSICVKGKVRHLQDSFRPKKISLAQVRAEVTNRQPLEDLYSNIQNRGLQLGSSFQGLKEVYTSYNGAYAIVELPEELIVGYRQYFIHPALFDSCIQAALVFAGIEQHNDRRSLYIPVHFDRVKFYKRPTGNTLYTYSEMIDYSGENFRQNFWIFDHDEQLVAEVHGLVGQYLRGSRGDSESEHLYRYQWRENAREKNDAITGKWLIFTDDRGIGQRLGDKINTFGGEVLYLHRGEQWQIPPSLSGILFLWALDNATNENLSAASIISAEDNSSLALLSLMQELTKKKSGTPLPIWICTSGGQQVTAGDSVALTQASLRGVGRTIMNELATIPCTLVDFSTTVEESEIEALVALLAADRQHDEVALRQEKIFVNKLERVSGEQLRKQAQNRVPVQQAVFRTVIDKHGVFDTLAQREIARLPLAPDEIEVEVKVAALNFRDIMVSMGLLTKEAIEGSSGACLGLECTGIVTRVGRDVTRHAVGDEVCGSASNSFSRFGVSHNYHFVKLPEPGNFAKYACWPIAVMTCYYSLVHLCRLELGEKILIHTASGGVGIVAIQIAQKIGAEVYATAGSEEKQQFLRDMGVEHVFNSRTLEFASQIREATGGIGVDVILNSLPGPAIYKSMELLRPFGRFVEIGKTDVYRNSPLGMKAFGDNISYFVVDIDRLRIQKPVYSGKMFAKAMDFCKDLDLPYKLYPIAQIADAFRYMASSRHIGKIAMAMEGEIDLLPPSEYQFSDDGGYLIVGGTSGMGLEVARWMAAKGAKMLFLLSRSGSKTDTERQKIKQLAQNAKVVCVRADVCDYQKMAKVFADITKESPLRGIIHAAMVLEDGSIANIDREKYLRAFMPKAIGCWNLHLLSIDCPLDFFVLFSSASSLYGNPGQVNYAAGNSFLDEFSCFRRAQGLVSTTINWGAIDEVGAVARDQQVRQHLARQGWYPLSVNEALLVLHKVLVERPVQLAAMKIDWGRLQSTTNSPRFAELVAQAKRESSSGVEKGNLRAALYDNPQQAKDFLYRQLRTTVAKTLGAATDDFDENRPITEMGLDSLMATQIIAWIRSNLGLNYSMMKIMRGPTLLELSDSLLHELSADFAGDSNEEQPKSESEKWIVRWHKLENPRVRLFCFPYFAGGASVFSSWPSLLPEDIEVCAIQLPGREERAAEPPIDQLETLLAELMVHIEPLLDCPFAFYGHSLGAVVSFELARKLIATKGLAPTQFIVGAWGAPRFKWPFLNLQDITVDEIYDQKNTDIIKRHLVSLEIPPSVLNDHRLMAEMMPVLRADIVMIGKRHRFANGQSVDFPITAIAGERDTVFDKDKVRCWQEHTSAHFRFATVDGGHLFVRDNKDELVSLLATLLQ